MGCADSPKLRVHDTESEFGFVAFATEMAQVEMSQVCGHDVGGTIGRILVGKMAVSTENSLFEAPRSTNTFLEHFDVMVCLEDEHVCCPDALSDKSCNVTKVGNESNVRASGSQQETHGVLCVVRHRKCIDQNVADFETVTCGKDTSVKARAKRMFNFILRRSIAINRNSEFPGYAGQTLNVIAVFVGDEDRSKILRSAGNGGKALSNLARAESGINQDARFVSLEIGAIPGRSTAENCQFGCHAGDISERGMVEQRFSTDKRPRKASD